MGRAEHWETVYRTKADAQLSWFQTEPTLSLRLILDARGGRGRVIDVGGGSSVLVDHLLSYSFERIAVLDISETALVRSVRRLGPRSTYVEWHVADITSVEGLGQFDVWHDRAVFHFLTDVHDREKYL